MPPSDPLERLREIVGGWPATSEKISHGSPTWWGGRKTFASFHVDHHGDDRVAVWCKSSFDTQEILVEAEPEVFFVPPYVGPSGWLGIRLDALEPYFAERWAEPSAMAACGSSPLSSCRITTTSWWSPTRNSNSPRS